VRPSVQSRTPPAPVRVFISTIRDPSLACVRLSSLLLVRHPPLARAGWSEDRPRR
jgi:hypothetical protein